MSDKIINFSEFNQIKEIKNLRTIEPNKLVKLEDEAEILREQIESLKQILHHQSQKLEQTEQELKYTNNELSAALDLVPLTLDEAKELAKNILSMEKPARNVLAEIISNFYNSSVKAEQL